MKNLSLKQSKRQKYNSVCSDDRQKIIKMFLENDYTAIQIAQLTGHNLSTIKAIYRIYKNEGRINKKERRDRQINIQQNVVVLMVDEKTRKMKIIRKQQLKQEFIMKNTEYTYESIQNTINQTFQNSTADLIKQLDGLSSKQCFNQLIKKIQIEGLDIKDFKEISEITNKFKNRIKISSQIQYFQNLFSQQESNYQEKQPQPTQKLNHSLNHDINDLKRIFEFQIKDYFLQSNDNLK
ncbi:unnamed protein product (macronuclear) [Paramecium tetraurelia]|uniref:Uncharacterized protein n=1 Tax=Paramecium tetraurelia TaxID=5888 RepID=A0DBP4_PARTE|nr:uncharacterized protein GSPATT00015358001 [Paramecium tetraurelia]CAK80461.1 unnamed protein product [Paramecium tetraurelia]|eukprot:XP_001447858.1 hypothetical protein (macronuclear) [Paramecium tetraurelia strain d4-2]